MKDIFLIDMDDTLFDFCRAEEINFFKTMNSVGVNADIEFYRRFHEINANLWKELECGKITREKLIVKRFEILAEEFGIDLDCKSVADKYFENFQNICVPIEGSKEFLCKLSQIGCIYIVTNGNTACQKRHMADSGFLPFIQRAFISDEIGINKPSAEFANYVTANIIGFERNRSVWIGDSLTSDMQCARQAKIDFILYSPYGAPTNYNGKYAADYRELLALLQTM